MKLKLHCLQHLAWYIFTYRYFKVAYSRIFAHNSTTICMYIFFLRVTVETIFRFFAHSDITETSGDCFEI